MFKEVTMHKGWLCEYYMMAILLMNLIEPLDIWVKIQTAKITTKAQMQFSIMVMKLITLGNLLEPKRHIPLFMSQIPKCLLCIWHLLSIRYTEGNKTVKTLYCPGTYILVGNENKINSFYGKQREEIKNWEEVCNFKSDGHRQPHWKHNLKDYGEEPWDVWGKSRGNGMSTPDMSYSEALRWKWAWHLKAVDVYLKVLNFAKYK